MRAVFKKECEISGTNICVKGEAFHHLVKVVRIRKGDEFLVLDGEGEKLNAEVIEIQRRDIRAIIKETIKDDSKKEIHVAIAQTKKEAFETMLRSCVQLGITHIHVFVSEFSSPLIELTERHQKILENSLIQSNNLFLPKIIQYQNFGSLIEELNSFSVVNVFSLGQGNSGQGQATGNSIFVIGPEGGLSSAEEETLAGLNHSRFHQLNTPILTAPVALSAAFGFLLKLGNES